MTDRELLELAAKAAGLYVGFEYAYTKSGRHDLYWSHVHHQLAWHDKTAGSEYPEPVFWNPLTDDGDALRLAVKLDLTVMIGAVRDVSGQLSLDKSEDDLEATRRAIVRAAAEIGRCMA
jgi:hypothetical protein